MTEKQLLKQEVEHLRLRLEQEKELRSADAEERAQEIAEIDNRRKRLEQEQKAKKVMNAKSLASISKQMKTLQSLQSKMAERQQVLAAAQEAKQQKRVYAAQSFKVKEQLKQEQEMATMKEQEAILQRQIAVQLEAQYAVQQQMRDESEKKRTDLLQREMAFVFRAAAERTRNEEETAKLRQEVEDLRALVRDTRHEAQCRRVRVDQRRDHVEKLQEHFDYLQNSYRRIDLLLNDGIESRGKDIREAQRCLQETQEHLMQLRNSRDQVFSECGEVKISETGDSRRDEETLIRLRRERDRKRRRLVHWLRPENERLMAARVAAEDAEGKAKHAAADAAVRVHEAELLNARQRQEESILGEQLADTLRGIESLRKRSNQLEGMVASVKVQLHETETEKAKFQTSQNAYETFLQRQLSSTATGVGCSSASGEKEENNNNNRFIRLSSAATTSTYSTTAGVLETPRRKFSRQSTPVASQQQQVTTDAQIRARTRVSLARKFADG